MHVPETGNLDLGHMQRTSDDRPQTASQGKEHGDFLFLPESGSASQAGKNHQCSSPPPPPCLLSATGGIG